MFRCLRNYCTSPSGQPDGSALLETVIKFLRLDSLAGLRGIFSAHTGQMKKKIRREKGCAGVGKKTHSPNIAVFPLNDWVYTHKTRPSPVCWLESAQLPTMRIGPPRADENRLDGNVFPQIICKSISH